MRKIDYILSYLHPVFIEQSHSKHNPVLEVTFYAGKYLLNSQNANYSNGSLNALFEKAFRKSKLNWDEINNALILGFGTGSVAAIINKHKADCIIDGVEIDKKVTELGEKYFDTGSLKNVTIHCTAADIFLEGCQKKYDLIIIDVFHDMMVPEELETEQFLSCMSDTLNVGGIVIFNKMIYSQASKDQLMSLKKMYEKLFIDLRVITVMFTNKILIAKKREDK